LLLDQVGRLQRNGTNATLLAGFTERDRSAELVAEGCDAEIAHRLAYSQRTIKNVARRDVVHLRTFGLARDAQAPAFI
jgi:DNA-binding NarL/FixJ family response regulator